MSLLEIMVSIIIPVYNVENYVEKCVRSVLAQTYTNIEVILVDDGSTDTSGAICEKLSLYDNRIRVYHKTNGGLSDARNYGIDKSNGELLFFLDSDDYMAKDTIEKLYQAMCEHRSDISLCSYLFVDEDGEVINVDEVNPVKDEILTDRMPFERLCSEKWWYYGVAWNKLYKRWLFDSIRFPFGRVNEDTYIMHEIFGKAKKIATISDPLIYYVQRNGSIMHEAMSVKSLDRVEAHSTKINYLIDNGYRDLIAIPFWHLDECYKKCIKGFKPQNESEEKRFNEIKVVYNETLKKAYFNDKKKYLRYRCPHLFSIYSRLSNVNFSRLKLLKKLICYHFNCRNKQVILIDTPSHRNIGDHAIALAEMQLLDNLGISYYELPAEVVNQNEKWYARFTREKKTIILPGGGFIGSVWPDEEYRFRRILKYFSNHKVIICPQTVTYQLDKKSGKKIFEDTRQIITNHNDLTFFLRDQASYAFVKDNFPNVKAYCVPDIVMGYKPEIRRKEREDKILLCFRADREKALTKEVISDLKDTLSNQYPDYEVQLTDTVNTAPISPEERQVYVKNKLEQFSTAKLTVVDRLHGMIFAAITNTPCIAFNNGNGKVGRVYEWIKKNPYIYFVNSLDEAREAIKHLDISREYSYDYSSIEMNFKDLEETLKALR